MRPEIILKGVYHEPEAHRWGDRMVWFLFGGATLMILRAIAVLFEK